jgi:hypothetical protein
VKAREAGMALPNTDNPTDAAIIGIVDDLREAAFTPEPLARPPRPASPGAPA